MARLVAATCPKCGAGVQLDPDQEWVTCSYCHVSSFIQTQKRRPTEEVVRTHQPVIHVQHKQTGCASALIALSILGGVGASFASVFMSALPVMFSTRATQTTEQSRSSTTSRPTLLSPLSPAAPEENFFNDSTQLRAKFEAALGGRVMLRQLVLYDTYVIFEAQDPKKKDHVDRYTYREGSVGDGSPTSLGSDKKRLDSILFPIETIDFSMIPGLAERARSELKVEAGKVSHIMIEKGAFGNKPAPVIRVYVSGPRESGYVEFSLKGEKKRVAGP